MSQEIRIEKKVLSENERLAAELRNKMVLNGVLSLNIVSSPGAGKTSLLEKTLSGLKDEFKIAVIAGDVQTENDANRLIKAGGEWVRPLVTGGSCHLDARMISRELKKLELKEVDLLLIENVGNLVCPSSYDLGEDMKVVVISVPEGDDKPLKYPGMFKRSGLMIVNKTDLLGTSDFSMDVVKKNALSINSNLNILETSCRTGDGIEAWHEWLRKHIRRAKKKSV
ncbi:MAG: hydrogenase nickel incorporation protein HypB [Acidobacteriota bacterium]